MIAEQAYKVYPKLTETESIILQIITDHPHGIHVNKIFKEYPCRNFAVSNALKRLEAFKLVCVQNFVWHLTQNETCSLSKKDTVRKMDLLNTKCVHRIEHLSKIEPEHELCSCSLKDHSNGFLE